MTSLSETPEEFAARINEGGRVFGIDLGTTTIGLAVSDIGLRIASPYETLARKKFSVDAENLLAHARRMDIQGFVIGLPINMDGTEGPRAQSTRAFVRNMKALTSLPFIYWDERLSTAAVTRTLMDADRSRKRRNELVDKMAASFILQGFLDRVHRAERADDLRRL